MLMEKQLKTAELEEQLEEQIEQPVVLQTHPPGLIGIATGKIGRYREFDKCCDNVIVPPSTGKALQIGNDIAKNYNDMVRIVLNDERFKWLWILGDDHVFHRELLMSLLERDVDVVVPLCIRRSQPYTPVLSGNRDGGYKLLAYDWLKGQTGLVELTKVTTGNAGMLIKRHVLEQMPEPWFENGKTYPERGGCDIWFCQKLIDMGIKVYLDLDNLIGHLAHVAVWYVRDDDGNHRAIIRNANWQSGRVAKGDL